MQTIKTTPPGIGTKVPNFYLGSRKKEQFNFHTLAGRPVLLIRLTGLAKEEASQLIQQVALHKLAELNQCLICPVVDNMEQLPTADSAGVKVGFQWLYDRENITQRVFKHAPIDQPYWVLLNRMLRVVDFGSFTNGFDCTRISTLLDDCKLGTEQSPVMGRAPILIVDRIFEPELCQKLMDYYQAEGGTPSGVMRQVGEVTKGFLDDSFKKRRDCIIKQADLIEEIKLKLAQRLRPLVYQAFHYDATRIERHLVGCYDSQEGGFFSPHVDNSTAATQHRKFAVTINLNPEAYEGGDLYFPEFGDDVYRAPAGGAIVFSGSLLHGVTRVVSGTRYAYLPFLYGEKEKELRDSTQRLIVPG